MQLIHLHILHFRNLSDITLLPAMCNVFFGQNGSGKTSILESIYLLSRGKSFRHHQPKYYIQHGFDTTTVFAKLIDGSFTQNAELAFNDIVETPETAAIEKSQNASTQLRLNGQNLVTQSPLSQRLPTLLLEPATLNGLEEGTQIRRELLDWLVFHVEQNFHSHWLAYTRILKQRNVLLKQPQPFSAMQRQEIIAWDSQLTMHAQHINRYREAIIQRWQGYFAQQIAVFLPQYADKLSLRYSVGFDIEKGLQSVLAERFELDKAVGYTRMGCHRADINIMLKFVDDNAQAHTLPATDMLSRGEKKLLMTALRLSQLPLLNQAGKVPLVLLDDITAELDERALSLLLTGLKQVKSQIFITSLSDKIMPMVQDIWQDEVKLFHVKQDNIVEIPHFNYSDVL